MAEVRFSLSEPHPPPLLPHRQCAPAVEVHLVPGNTVLAYRRTYESLRDPPASLLALRRRRRWRRPVSALSPAALTTSGTGTVTAGAPAHRFKLERPVYPLLDDLVCALRVCQPERPSAILRASPSQAHWHWQAVPVALSLGVQVPSFVDSDVPLRLLLVVPYHWQWNAVSASRFQVPAFSSDNGSYSITTTITFNPATQLVDEPVVGVLR